jgi:asparagine synthase (glutamine-hydrolysing)
MLFNGEAIFGVIDFSEQSQGARCRAEQISQRARQLGARAECQAFGAAVFGWAKRRDEGSPHDGRRHDATIPIAVVGEAFSSIGSHERFSAQDNNCDWIAEGYATQGLEFLGRLDGTFALALWDSRSRTLTLMTDRRSDAQLFYRMEANQLLFGSWLNLLAPPKPDFDRRSIHEFLRFLYIAPPRTIYKGICRLEPGHYLEATNGTITVSALKRGDRENGSRSWVGSSDEALNRFQDLFEKAIERRIGSRRVGVFLSSGVDSATLMAGCHRTNPGHVEAFTVGFDNAELDETNAARAYANHFGVPHSVLKFDMREYRRAFGRMTQDFDQPFADPAGLPLVLASDAVKERVDVISGGTGGDDLFGAPIPRHLWFMLKFSSKLPLAFRMGIATLLKDMRWLGLSQRASLFDFGDPEELLITWSGWSKRELEDLLGQKVSFEETGFYRAFKAHQNDDIQGLYDALGVFPPDDCRFEAAAPANIPIELPYHDADLHTFVQSLPLSLRMHDGVSKVLLKDLFARYFPEELRLAKKHYFNIPLQSLLANDNFELVREYLGRDMMRRHECVDYERAGQWIGRYIAGDESLMFKVWALLVLHAWLESRN